MITHLINSLKWIFCSNTARVKKQR